MNITDYASTNYNRTDENISIGAASPVKLDSKGIIMPDLMDIQIEAHAKSKESSLERVPDLTAKNQTK